eukprot:3026965-Pyramimonas_sp.AAC.1
MVSMGSQQVAALVEQMLYDLFVLRLAPVVDPSEVANIELVRAPTLADPRRSHIIADDPARTGCVPVL